MKRRSCLSLLSCIAMPGMKSMFPATLWAEGQVKSDFATVNGVRLQYLDWGGRGPAMLFLPGAGHSAYIFSDIAPRFTDSFRVLGLTRRGQGRSEKPPTGYDTATLVEDIRRFLDAMKIGRVILVGHSLAGDELTRFAGTYPARVIKLVYLDAAYDRGEIRERVVLRELADVFALVAPSSQDLASLDAYRRWLRSRRYNLWSNALEADLHEIVSVTPRGIQPTMPGPVGLALAQSTEESHPDYRKVMAPALGIYAITGLASFFWLTADVDPRLRRKTEDFLRDYLIPAQRTQIERFAREVRQGTVVELANASHYCFIDKEEEVVSAMRAFLQGTRN